MHPPRHRLHYAIAIALVIAMGLASRSGLAVRLPTFVASYAGDTLWALTLFLCLGFAFPAQPTWRVAVAAVAGSFAVEFSQLYQSEWANDLRATRIGGLLLGKGFLASDLACYSVGAAIGAASEWIVVEREANRP